MTSPLTPRSCLDERQAKFNHFADRVISEIGGLPGITSSDLNEWAEHNWMTWLSKKAGIALISFKSRPFPEDFEITMNCGHALRLLTLAVYESTMKWEFISAYPGPEAPRVHNHCPDDDADLEEFDGIPEYDFPVIEYGYLQSEIREFLEKPGGELSEKRQLIIRNWTLQKRILASIAVHWWDEYKKCEITGFENKRSANDGYFEVQKAQMKEKDFTRLKEQISEKLKQLLVEINTVDLPRIEVKGTFGIVRKATKDLVRQHLLPLYIDAGASAEQIELGLAENAEQLQNQLDSRERGRISQPEGAASGSADKGDGLTRTAPANSKQDLDRAIDTDWNEFSNLLERYRKEHPKIKSLRQCCQNLYSQIETGKHPHSLPDGATLQKCYEAMKKRNQSRKKKSVSHPKG